MRTKRSIAIVVMALAAVVFPALPASAATLVVDDDGFGTQANCDDGVAPAATTIQAAVNAAFSGDTVFVCPGVYAHTTTPGITVNKALTITSGGAAGAVVSGDTKNGSVANGSDVLFMVTASGVTIEKLTVDLGNDDGDYDVGVFSPDDGSVGGLVIQYSIFRFAAFGNALGEQLIHLGGGAGNTVRYNDLETASANSTLYLGSAAHTSLVFSYNTIAPVLDANGGGTAVNSFGPVLDSTFSGNEITMAGIGIYLGAGTAATDNVTVTRNTFTGLTSTHPSAGGAVVITSEVNGVATGNIQVTYNTFNANAGKAVSIFDWDPATADVNGDTIGVNRNAIELGNADGLAVGAGVTGTVNGSCNWWGSNTGPGPVGSGAGSTVTAGVNFSPWLTSPSLDSTCGAPPPADGSASAVAEPGGTVSTDHSGDGATPATPVETSVTTPNGGTVIITSGPAGAAPAGFSVLGTRVSITAPNATAANPLVIAFTLDASLIPLGMDASSIAVLKNGVLVPVCTGAPGVASPDPCVASRTTLPSGDARIVVLTSTASDWMLGIAETTCRGLIATIVGNSAANVLNGTPGDDVIWAGDGDDVVRADGGNDTICLGKGNDTAYGGAGNDNISGGPGSDTIFGGAGQDRLRGHPGTDRLHGGTLHDVLIGGLGADWLFGNGGRDALWGNGGSDTGDGGIGADRCASVEAPTSCEA